MKRFVLAVSVALLGAGLLSAARSVADAPTEPTPTATSGIATPLGSVRLSDLPPVSPTHALPAPPLITSRLPPHPPAPITAGPMAPEGQTAAIPGSVDLLERGSVRFFDAMRQITVTYTVAAVSDPVTVSTDGRMLTFTLPYAPIITAQKPLDITVQGISDCGLIDASRFYVCAIEDSVESLLVSFRTDVSQRSLSGSSSSQVTLAEGWNLISNAAWMPLTGPLYTFQAGDSTYEQVAPNELQDDLGYLLYSAYPATLTIHTLYPAARTVSLPPGNWVLVGNSTAVPLVVSGADLVYTYAPSNGYRLATELQPGQGAWAYATDGGVVTLSPASP